MTIRVTNAVRSAEGDVHVMPTYGRPHDATSDCWCEPTIDPLRPGEKRYATLWIHKEQN